MHAKTTNKIVSLFLSLIFLFSQTGIAQAAAELNLAAYLSPPSYSSADKLRLPSLRYFSYDNLTNNLKIVLDKGDLTQMSQAEVQDSAQQAMAYFLIGVTLPDECFWVNLRPDSPENMIDDYLVQTDVGKIMLEADVELKKDTARFTSPQTPEGKLYWDKLYQKAGEIFGSENITIPTLTRPWIVPGEVIVRESADSAYIYKAGLKVMLEQDRLKNSSVYNFSDPRMKTLNEYSSQLIRELIIPKLTKEVNTGRKYASLRQAYYSLILARWFKTRFYGKGGTYASAINKKNLNGLTSKDAWSKLAYFNAYQKSFKQGEYNLQVPVATLAGQSIRSYFSGGVSLVNADLSFPQGTMTVNSSPIIGLSSPNDFFGKFSDDPSFVSFRGSNADPAMLIPELQNSSPIRLEKVDPEEAKSFGKEMNEIFEIDQSIAGVAKNLKATREYENAAEYIQQEAAIKKLLETERYKIRVVLSSDYGSPVSVMIPDDLTVKKEIYEKYIAKIYAEGQALRNGRSQHLYVEAYNASGRRLPKEEKAISEAIDAYFKTLGFRLYGKANAGNPVIVERKPDKFTPEATVGLDNWLESAYHDKLVTKREGAVTLGIDIGGQGMKARIRRNGKDVTEEVLAGMPDTEEARSSDKSLLYRYSYLGRSDSGLLFKERLVEYAGELKDAVENKYGKGIIGGVFINMPGAPDYKEGRMGSIGGLSANFNEDYMAQGISEVNRFIPELIGLFDNAVVGFGNDMTGWAYSLLAAAKSALTKEDAERLKNTLIVFDGTGIGTLLIKNGSEVTGANECGHLIANVNAQEKDSRAPDSPFGSFEDMGGSVRGILAMARELGLTEKLVALGLEEKNITPKHIGLAATGINPVTNEPWSLMSNGGIEIQGIAQQVWDRIEQVEAAQIILLYRLTGETNVVFGGGTAAGKTGELRVAHLRRYIEQYSRMLGITDKIEVILADGEINAADGAALKAEQLYNRYAQASSTSSPLSVEELDRIMKQELTLRGYDLKNNNGQILISRQYLERAPEASLHPVGQDTSAFDVLRRGDGEKITFFIDYKPEAITVRAWDEELRKPLDLFDINIKAGTVVSVFSSKPTSSPMKAEDATKGGIDFRSIPLTIQPIGNFGSIVLQAPQAAVLENINPDAEMKQLARMVQSGMLPSGQRVKELIYACYYKNELSQMQGGLVSCLTDICRLQEEQGVFAEPELKESLVLLEFI
ncbi:MAG: hypothetical protein WC532_00055 [Candidatus Omnitrophota bacterium]